MGMSPNFDIRSVHRALNRCIESARKEKDYTPDLECAIMYLTSLGDLKFVDNRKLAADVVGYYFHEATKYGLSQLATEMKDMIPLLRVDINNVDRDNGEGYVDYLMREFGY